MKFSTTTFAGLVFLATSVLATPQDFATTSSTGTGFSMAHLKELKVATREKSRGLGHFKKGNYGKHGKNVSKCKNGKVDGLYACSNVDLYGFLSHEEMGSVSLEGNDIWGWTSKTGREFGVVGQVDGTAFVEVLKDGTLKYLGRLGPQTVPSIWRDIKVLGDYAYIGSEAEGHGLQIFDLKKLLKLKPNAKPAIFSTATDISHFAGFGSSHNLVVSESSKTIIAVGSKLCNGGLFFVDVRDPLNPKDAGCAAEDGYVHDAQCTIYKGPDRAHRGKEICFGYNEDTLTIYDITTKSAPTIISRTPYAGAAYSHQGWLANDEQTYLLLDDELDEVENTAPGGNNRTTTYVWDIKKLSAPVNTGLYKGQAKSIDHNQYVLKGLTYQANYGSGLRIVDVSSIAKKPDGSKFKEVGFFDCYPEDDEDKDADTNQFYGTWSVYPYFKSGYLLLNSIERGVFALKYTGKN